MPRKRAHSNDGDAPSQNKKSKIADENDGALNGESSSVIDTQGVNGVVKGVDVRDGDVDEERGNLSEGNGEGGIQITDGIVDDAYEDDDDEEAPVQDDTHFGASTEFWINTFGAKLHSPLTPIDVRLAFSENEEGVSGVETLCARATQVEDENPIGCMKALTIDRSDEGFTTDFHRTMEYASQLAGDLARDLFDRSGNLKRVFIDHPFRKGSGVWDEELDEEETIMIVESIGVSGKMRRRGIANSMWRLALAQAKERDVAWVYVAPTPRRRFETLGEHHRNEDIAFAFWRSHGFRRVGLSDWFCYAVDEDHASRSLPTKEDVDPPKDDEELADKYAGRGLGFGMSQYENAKEKLPLHFALTTMTMLSLVAFFDKEVLTHPASTSYWSVADSKGNTILHVAAMQGYSECVRWIRNNLGSSLDEVRNHRGCTALEELEEYLDSIRQTTAIGDYHVNVSNAFRGYHDEFVASSLILQNPDGKFLEQDFLREKYGCTCGQCLGGFLSPRMRSEMEVQATCIHDEYRNNERYQDPYDAEPWTTDVQKNPYISTTIKSRLASDKEWTNGYVETFRWIEKCLRLAHRIPSQDGVLRMVNENADMRDSIGGDIAPKDSAAMVSKFLSTGGKFEDVLRVLFGAMKEKHYDFEEIMCEDYVEELPDCRNNFEYDFAAAMCGVVDTTA